MSKKQKTKENEKGKQNKKKTQANKYYNNN